MREMKRMNRDQMDWGCRERKIMTQIEILEYCVVGKGSGIIRRRLWMRDKSNIECLRKDTPAQYLISHYTKKGKRKKMILSTFQQKKEVHLISKSMSNPRPHVSHLYLKQKPKLYQNKLLLVEEVKTKFRIVDVAL